MRKLFKITLLTIAGLGIFASPLNLGALIPVDGASCFSRAAQDSSCFFVTRVFAADDFGLEGAAPDLLREKGDLNANIAMIIRALLGFVSVLFFLLIVYGGVNWMLGSRAGKEKEINRAKSIITQAAVGLIIVLTAYAVTYWITAILTTASTAQ